MATMPFHMGWSLTSRNNTVKHTVDTLQDIRLARFTPCFLPVVTAIPAILGGLILFFYLLQLLNLRRPRWSRPFIEETKQSSDDLPTAIYHPSFWVTYCLLVLSLIGLSIQVVAIFIPSRQLTAIFPSLAWVRQSKFYPGYH
jgi:hypothetical protein